MAKLALGVDIGTDSIKVVAGAAKRSTFQVRQLLVVPVPREASGEPSRLAAPLREALRAAGLKGEAACGLTGRDVVIRYTQVPEVPDWQLRQLMEFEIGEMREQSGEELAADFNLVPVPSDVSSDDTVLLALAKRGVLDAHGAVLEAAGLKLKAFVPNAIALYDAYRQAGPDEGVTVLLNLGARHTDVTIVKDGDLLFARNISGGGDLFDEALAASFNVSVEKARRLKTELANVAPPEPGRRAPAASPQEEKVSRALAGAVGQVLSMVQSSLTFARSQTGQNELKADRVLLSGGGSRLRGLDRYLAANLGVDVAAFDPFAACDVAAVEDALDDDARARAGVALGLALAAAGLAGYSLEILPEKARRAKVLRERTLFLVLAGVLALAYLGYDAFTARADTQLAEQDDELFRREQDQRKRREQSWVDTGGRLAENGRRLALLEDQALRGVSLQRTMVLLQRHLPQDLYVRSITLKTMTDPVLGIEGTARPVVEVRGEGREGAQGLEQTFNRFAELLGVDPLLGRRPKTATAPASAKKPFEWSVWMYFAPPAAEAGGEETGDTGDADAYGPAAAGGA